MRSLLRPIQLARQTRRLLTTDSTQHSQAGGIGNVKDQMMSSTFHSPDNDSSYKAYPLFRPIPHPQTIAVIPAPMTYGQPFMGTDQGPALLLDKGLNSALSSLGWRVDLCNEVNPDIPPPQPNDPTPPPPAQAKNSTRVGLGCKSLACVTHNKTKEGLFALTLGGDHSVALGSLAGVLRHRPNTGVIWVDAHADLNNPWISGSGNMHGMPVGLLMDEM